MSPQARPKHRLTIRRGILRKDCLAREILVPGLSSSSYLGCSDQEIELSPLVVAASGPRTRERSSFHGSCAPFPSSYLGKLQHTSSIVIAVFHVGVAIMSCSSCCGALLFPGRSRPKSTSFFSWTGEGFVTLYADASFFAAVVFLLGVGNVFRMESTWGLIRFYFTVLDRQVSFAKYLSFPFIQQNQNSSLLKVLTQSLCFCTF